ncbi:MAG: 3'(2'),5'-bisphosphate nucleotidase CysQ [Nitrospinae bacterium]|nr:3'(2'),5'-bisphosphate nucleotidase CysQ [Nitrospinota bacterium]
MSHSAVDLALAEAALVIAREAGRAIMTIYREEDLGVTVKGDDSPLTRADLAAHRIIVDRLPALGEGWPVLSEESRAIDFDVRKGWRRYWLVDPLDGTKEFINRRDEFTVNIALVENGRPILGVVTAPALGREWLAAEGCGAFAAEGERRRPIRAHGGDGPLRIVASKSHVTPELERFLAAVTEPTALVNIGSSLKFCLVAEGGADLYPRLGPTMEWDTAAAQAIVTEAGGRVETLAGTPLAYNKESLLNPYFMVTGLPPYDWRRYADALPDA